MFVAIFTLFVALVTLVVASITLYNQYKHNRISVKPIGVIQLTHSTLCLEILLKNNGAGPLIIKKVEIYNEKNCVTDEIIQNPFFTEENWMITQIRDKSYTIFPGMHYTVLSVSFGSTVLTKPQEKRKQAIIDALTECCIHFKYSDIYDNEQDPIKFKLEIIGTMTTHLGFTSFPVEPDPVNKIILSIRKIISLIRSKEPKLDVRTISIQQKTEDNI